MSIQHALLTSLLEKPSTGYGLASRFDRSIGYFWHASHQQIYRELRRMAVAGWVVADEDGQVGGRKRKTYRVLPAGTDELRRWVSEPAPDLDGQRELLVKLRAEAVLGPLGARDELLRLMACHEARLDTFRQIEKRDFPEGQMTVSQQLQYRVLAMGIQSEESWLAWARETLPVLEAALSDHSENRQ